MTTFQHLPSLAKLPIILGSSLLALAVSAAFAQWPPEVLLHRQSDRPGSYYEKVVGLGDWTGDGIGDFAVLTDASIVDFWWGGTALSRDPDTSLNRPDTSYFYDVKAAGDLTGDGISELVFACWSHILVYRGGRGQVEELQVLPIDVTDIAVPGDISGDGIPDLIVGYAFPSGRLLVYLGTPTGFIGPVDTLEGVGYHLGGGLVSGADMDADGWGDFACRYNDTWDTTVVLFHPQPGNYLGHYELFKGHIAVLIPQAYQSGRPAMVLGYYSHQLGAAFRIYLGGSGLDTIPDAILALDDPFFSSLPSSIGDVNDDGWEDWVGGSDGNFGGLGAFLLFLGGSGISNYSYWHGGFTGYWAEGKAMTGVGDVNGDGIDDFAMLCSRDTTGHGGSQLVVFAGDGEWHVAADDRRPAPVRLPVTIQAYPNPFNASTRIVIEGLRAGSLFDLSIHNILGQEVFHSQERAVTDRHTSAWQPDQRLSGGIYFCSVNTGISKQTRKLLLIR